MLALITPFQRKGSHASTDTDSDRERQRRRSSAVLRNLSRERELSRPVAALEAQVAGAY